jgi:hypothetical protein
MHPQFGARWPRRSYRAQSGAAQSAAALFDDSLHRIPSVTGRFAMDVAELLQLVQRGVINTRHITTRYFPLDRR